MRVGAADVPVRWPIQVTGVYTSQWGTRTAMKKIVLMTTLPLFIEPMPRALLMTADAQPCCVWFFRSVGGRRSSLLSNDDRSATGG